MPEEGYEILNARVKQKTDTEANWLANDLIILEGEQAFVVNDEGAGVNFKIGDGTKTFAELDYFIAYYSDVLSQKILTYLNQTANITVSSTFRDKSNLYDIVIVNNSGGVIDLKVGTTDGGSEICSVPVPVGPVTISIKHYFTAATTVYLTGLTDKAFSMFIMYYQYDEAPATPVGSGGGSSLYKKGTTGMFFPIYAGHEDDVWDFITGLGKPDTGYQNCALFGYQGLPSMAGYYPVGLTPGDTPGATTGVTSHQISITTSNLPEHDHLMFNGDSPPPGNDLIVGDHKVTYQKNNGINRDYLMTRSSTTPDRGRTGKGGGVAGAVTPINIQPKSRIFYYFAAITDE